MNKNIKTVSIFKETGRTLYRTPLIVGRLRKLFIKEKVNIVVAIESMKVLFTLPAAIALPITHICWEHFNFKNVGHNGRLVARKLAGLYCDHIITLTERDKEYWLKGVRHKSQIVAIPNPTSIKTLNKEYVNKECNNIVIAVGHLLPVKGFDMLLEAWAKVIAKEKSWKLIIVGEGSEREKLEAYIQGNGLDSSVSLPGKTKDIEKYYREADILCLTSRYEGLPMVLIEGISYGLPIVSFDCDTGPAEILSNTGSILVPQGDIEQFSESLIQLMNSREQRIEISLKSIEKAKEYNASKIIEEWINLIES